MNHGAARSTVEWTFSKSRAVHDHVSACPRWRRRCTGDSDAPGNRRHCFEMICRGGCFVGTTGNATTRAATGSSTMSAHVIYESRLELARLLMADFDASVNHIVAQPFMLCSANLREDSSSHS